MTLSTRNGSVALLFRGPINFGIPLWKPVLTMPFWRSFACLTHTVDVDLTITLLAGMDCSIILSNFLNFNSFVLLFFQVSIGSDAVYAAEAYYQNGTADDTDANTNKTKSSIEQISAHYGAQAVVISIDPQRVYTNESSHPVHKVVPLQQQKNNNNRGPNGEKFCWYQCTVKGGRETRDICAVRVAMACEKLGAGEIMLNCIDMDGQCQGYDHELMKAVSEAVTIPVIASSGAGKPVHFTNVFRETGVQAALAAGMFHRKEVGIDEVKKHMVESGVPARLV